MPGLFNPILLERLAFNRGFRAAQCEHTRQVFRKLLSRKADGSLAALSETRIEQSFNEQLFNAAFGYSTLLQTGAGAYHLLPKFHHPTRSKRSLYDDFALGHFDALGGRPIVSAEFKSPGSDLDAPQSATGYGGRTPVEQAFRTAGKTPSVKWVIVSNFDEIRLYSMSRGTQQFESVVLSDMLTGTDVRRALVLFERLTLLGEKHNESPLQKLLDGVLPVILPAKIACSRLVLEARPLIAPLQEAALHAMDDALKKADAARKRRWPLLWDGWSPELVDGDRLVFTAEDEKHILYQRIEFARNGTFRSSEYLPFHPSAAVVPMIDPLDVACRIASFLEFVDITISSIFPGNIEIEGQILDTKDAQLSERRDWFGPGLQLSVKCRVESTRMPPTQLDMGDVVRMTTRVLRELFYPFEGRTITNNNIVRLAPTTEQIRVGLTDCLPK